MTTIVVTDEQLGAFSRRQHELFHRVRKGTLPFDLAMDGLQRLIEGNLEASTAPTSYPVSVDRSLTLAEMIKAGRYDNQVDAVKSITEERFPVDRSGELTYKKELFLIAPSRDGITTREWHAELSANGWELEQTPELLAFGEKYPKLQRDHYIIAFGSAWVNPDGFLYSPGLWSDDGTRKADMHWFHPGNQWGSRNRALVSRKRR